MALEVQEIAIQMQVSNGLPSVGQRGASMAGRPSEPALDKEALVQECVRRVLEAIKETKER